MYFLYIKATTYYTLKLKSTPSQKIAIQDDRTIEIMFERYVKFNLWRMNDGLISRAENMTFWLTRLDCPGLRPTLFMEFYEIFQCFYQNILNMRQDVVGHKIVWK